MSGFPFVSVWDFCLLFRQLPFFFFFFDKLALDPVLRAGWGGQDWKMEVIGGPGAGLCEGYGVTLLLKGESNTLSQWLFWVPA